MGLRDDAKPKFWGGYLVEGLHPMIFGPERDEDIDTNEPGDLSPEDERLAEKLSRSVPAVWTPEYCAMSECSRRMAQMIGRARAEARAAQDAVADNASRYFVLQQINRILEVLQ